MKTAISVPDNLFRMAERLAHRLKKSRSQLYQEAVAEYLERHDPDAVTAAINRAAESLESATDPFVAAAARRVLERSEW